MTTTFLVLADQLSTRVAPWPTMSLDTVVLLIESDELIHRQGHVTRTAIYLSAVRAFERDVEALGFRVDRRRAPSFKAGVAAHIVEFEPDVVAMNTPRGRRAQRYFSNLGVAFLGNPFVLTDPDAFASKGYRTMEAFYRDQRRRLGILMEGDAPVGGTWNLDTENRRPLPRDGGVWPVPWRRTPRAEEHVLLEELRPHIRGADALEFWPTTRTEALEQLADAVARIIPTFGPFEDAASTDNWHLAHSRLSVALNLGLLHPREVVDAVITAHDEGTIPLQSAEGFIRQVVGWREWVAMLHTTRDDSYRDANALGATEPLPATWVAMAPHPMACIDMALRHLADFGWTHHIERLMVLTSSATLAGIEPLALNDWMATAFVDGAEWVMEANVLGMGTFADGGATATKPYVSGGAYINKMTNACRSCRYVPTERTGPTACPLTTLYWDFLARNDESLRTVARIAPQLAAARRREDLVEIRAAAPRARAIIAGTSDGDVAPRRREPPTASVADVTAATQGRLL